MMNIRALIALTAAIPAAIAMCGCTGMKTFTTAARAGDTVALAVGWNVNVSRSNLAATITPASGAPVTYAIGNPNIRAVVNTYPDPMSRLVVGTETNQSLGYNANLHGNNLNSAVTGGDRDWAQTLVLLNLPPTLAAGTASIALTAGGQSVTAAPLSVEILPGTGTANTFDGASGGLTAEQLGALERASGSVVTFTGSTIPYAIYLEIGHTPAVGVPWVVNPRGDIKNVAWSDTGSVIKVLLTPVNGMSPQQLVDFKFFVSGGLSGLAITSVKAYDVNGNPISGFAANISAL